MYAEWVALRNELIFEATPRTFPCRCASALTRLEKELRISDKADSTAVLIRDIAIDLCSYLPEWTLEKISRFELRKQADMFLELLESYGYYSLAADAKEQIHRMTDSRWIKFTEEAHHGKIFNCWGNDNGLGTMEAMRRGASFVTTNPPIINLARENCKTYDCVRDAINAAHPDELLERRVSRFAMQVVLDNCRALRPIYILTKAKEGYVNYQVNPRNNHDVDKMVDEIEFVYSELSKQLSGKPNVVFKVPGVYNSLEVVRRVTAEGIGVNITVNFSVSQCEAFAEVIEQGIADQSFVTIMAGRLDNPVGEELSKAGVVNSAELCRNASRLVTRRVYQQIILAKQYQRVEILVASLRGPWNVCASIANNPMSRIIISSFPDKADEYDRLGRAEIHCNMADNISEEILQTLRKSELFCKAYDFGAMQPDEFDIYPPVVATLSGFISSYEQLEKYMS